MHYVYVLQSKLNGSIYIGSTNDLRKRVKLHNAGKAKYTRSHKPWNLIYYEAYSKEGLARMREKRLKQHGNAKRQMMKRAGLYPAPFFAKNGAGFIAFTTLLVVSAIALAVSVSISLLGVGEVKSSLDFKKGQEVAKIAESCVEEALLRLRNNDTYTGTVVPLPVGNGSCTISISGAGVDRTIDISATISGPPDYVKNIQATAKRTGNSINIVSWSEVE